MTNVDIRIFSLVTFLTYTLGIVSTYHVIMSNRTSQAVIAWSVSLCTFPMIALPVYWIFGRTKFNGYIDARRGKDQGTNSLVVKTLERLPDSIPDPNDLNADQKVMEKLAAMPYTHFNQIDLTTNGRDTFDSIFEAIQNATSYVLVQFYIFRDDGLGREFYAHLRDACARGVRVYILYDGIGSARLSNQYLRDLRATGAQVSGFRTTRGPRNRFQINFRNHRKIVVVDGTIAFVGGYNVGDEYLGKYKRFGPWRDTHCKIQGPGVLAVQLSFASDWNWAQDTIPPHLKWEPQPAPDRDERILVVPSGPSDKLETWKLMMLQCIRQADERFWLVSPYFVPDTDIESALQLAAMRGVDVRIMLPNKADHLMVWLASFSFLKLMETPNIRFYRYLPGFLHQKVILVDDELAVVGTANADNRSFRLNFEISITGIDPHFIDKVSTMLEEDFNTCRLCGVEEYKDRSFLFQFSVQICRLMAPIL
jgi:cardiolipin synthase